MTYKKWNLGDPEPDPETVVEADALDFSWRLPWKVVREDAISGLAAVYIEDKDADTKRSGGRPTNDSN